MSTVGGDPVSAAPVERLHALLVAAVQQRRGADPYAAPVTVAEIYQDLVPYRSVRATLGLDMNADYEHTLLRLLSGENGLTRVEPAAAREQMERELESPNPNVALYRKFAGCDVWLLPSGAATPAWVTEHLAEVGALEAAVAPEPLASEARAEPLSPAPIDTAPPADVLPATPASPTGATGARHREQPQAMTTDQEKSAPVTAQTPTDASARSPRAAASSEVGHCAFCDSALPAGRRIRFCPYCGQDQSQQPCAVCGEPVQQEWAFCIACGEAVETAEA